MKSDKIIIGLLLMLGLMLGWKSVNIYLASRDQGDLPNYLAFFKGAKPEDVTAIKLNSLNKEIVISKDEKTNSSWLVDGYVADKIIVESITSSLLMPKNIMIVAESNSSHDRLDVGTQSALLTLTNKSGEEFRVNVGSTTSGGRHVKLANSDNVYLVSGLPAAITSVIETEWADKEAFSIKLDDIKSISIERKSNLVKITKEAQEYKDQSGKKIDPASITSFLTNIESLKAMNVMSELEMALDPVTAESKIEVEAIDGTKTVLTLAYPKDRTYGTAEVGGKKGYYKLTEAVMNSLDLKSADLTYLP